MLSFDFQPQIIVAVAVGLVAIGSWYFYQAAKGRGWRSVLRGERAQVGAEPSKTEDEGKADDGTKTRVSIYDVESRTIEEKELTQKERGKIGDLGQEWNLDGVRLYELVRRKVEGVQEGEAQHAYEAVPPAKVYTYASPTELFNDLNLETETAIVISLKGQKSLLEQYGKYIPWAVALAFVMFMFVAEINA